MENLLNIKDAAIYCGTYAKYNNGSLYGKWMKLSDYDSKVDFIDACLELHKDESDPELMFQDYENIPDGLCGESFVSDLIWDLLSMDDHEIECIVAYRDCTGYKWDYCIKHASNNCKGYNYASKEDFAWSQIYELYGDNPLKHYIDIDRYSRDLFYDYMFSNGFVFSK